MREYGYEHDRDRLLRGHEVLFMESLTTRLLPTLQTRNVQEPMKSSDMISTCGRGGCKARGERGGRGRLNAFTIRQWVTFKRIASLCTTFITRQLISLKLKLLNPNSLMKKTKNEVEIQ